VSLAVFS